GWLVSQMDMGGGIAAREVAKSRVTTVAIEEMRFWHPVRVGDTVCCYAKLLKIGNTSMSFDISAWVLPQGTGERVCVTEAIFTFVAIDLNGRPVPVKRN
ncbi:MAG: hotdog domain-containing protein, partial [Planctomycetota bacterium]